MSPMFGSSSSFEALLTRRSAADGVEHDESLVLPFGGLSTTVVSGRFLDVVWIWFCQQHGIERQRVDAALQLRPRSVRLLPAEYQ